jgi:class 3 adenylate cyclase
LVLLDILLPEVNGYKVLETIRSDPRFRHLPVIVLSGVSEMDSVVRCIEMGADDYLPKPFNPVLLRARIEACLEKKWLRDKEEANLHQLQIEREKSEILLRSILPEPIAERLKQGEHTIVDQFEDVTVLFADLVGFSRLAARLTPQELVQTLNEIFTEFDRLAVEHGLEKIKTIGDAYMVVGGLPMPSDNHPMAVASMALAIQRFIQEYNLKHGSELNIRIGLHTGPVIAGIIGRNKFTYDLWGDTVNVASRMESQGQPGAIQLTIVTAERIRSEFHFEPRGVIDVKGKGEMSTFLLLGRK